MAHKPKVKRVSTYTRSPAEQQERAINVYAQNDKQDEYIRAITRSDQVIVCGFSGTGKTYIAASIAAQMYLNKKISKIILTRPNVSVGRDLGAFPGDLNEKFANWAVPVLEVLRKHLGSGVVDTGIKNGNIEMVPLSVMRGRSFKDAFVIMDEGQNTTVEEMKMFLTRVGESCKVVVNGDIRQSDIQRESGLAKIIQLARKHDMNVPVIEFGVEDIVRSDICKQWIIAFEQK